MNINTVMKTLEKAQKIHKEQDVFWDTFDEHWSTEERHVEDKNLTDEVDNFIITKIAEALKECNHNRTHTADKLGIKRETLLAKMKKYCLV